MACRTDQLLSSGTGLVPQHSRQWDGAGGEGWLHTHAALLRVRAWCGGAGLPAAGDSGPSHTLPQTSVPGITILQSWALLNGGAPEFRMLGAGSAVRGLAEPCWALLQSRFCLAGGQKLKTAHTGHGSFSPWMEMSPALCCISLPWLRAE